MAMVASPNSTLQSKATQRGHTRPGDSVGPAVLRCGGRVWHKCSSWWPCQAMAVCPDMQRVRGREDRQEGGAGWAGAEATLLQCHLVCTGRVSVRAAHPLSVNRYNPSGVHFTDSFTDDNTQYLLSPSLCQALFWGLHLHNIDS